MKIKYVHCWMVVLRPQTITNTVLDIKNSAASGIKIF
jgi:hypothetical protein